MSSSSQAQAATGAASPVLPPVGTRVVLVATVLLACGAGLLAAKVSIDKAALLLIGAVLGFALLHGAFGFTAGWRNLVMRGDGRGLKAQLAVIAATTVCFVPLIAGLLPGGRSFNGLIAPVTLTVVIGSFMFGMGMQLSNGCGSGTLFTLGGGSKRMLFTLPAFIAGSFIASLQLTWWDLPGIGVVDLGRDLGVRGALLVNLAGLGAIWGLAVLWERQSQFEQGRGHTVSTEKAHRLWALRGPWSYLVAGAALVALNVATLLIGGAPWAVTYGFALWGAAIASLAGFDVSGYGFWGWAQSPGDVFAALFTNKQSVMNVGLILGAMLASGLSGSFGKGPWPGFTGVAAAVLGGLLMGYGARLSFGCNIGAFLGGIASGSLHGWVWFVSAFAGSLIGIRLRPRFGLDP